MEVVIAKEPEPVKRVSARSGIQSVICEITDANTNKKLVFVNVKVEGAQIGGVTNSKGMVNLKVKTEYIENNLLVSHIGYESQSVAIGPIGKKMYIKLVPREAAKVDKSVFPHSVYLCDDQFTELYNVGQIIPMNAMSKSCFGTYDKHYFDNCKGKSVYSFEKDCGVSIDARAVNCNGEYTIEVYFKMDKNNQSWNRLMSWGDGDNGLYLSPSRKKFDFWVGGSRYAGSFKTGEWYYVVATRSKAGKFTLWANGKAILGTMDARRAACGDLLVLFADIGGGASSEAFSGQVAYVSTSSKAVGKTIIEERNKCMPCCECSYVK